MFSKLLTFVVVALGASCALATPTSPPPVVTGTATEYTPGPVATGTSGAVKSEDLVAGVDGVGEILLCVNVNFRAPCVSALYLENTCTNVPTNFQDNVSVVQPAEGVDCVLYADLNCVGGQNIVTIYPGYSNLAAQGFNDRLTAFFCGGT
ncbi:hypothetical protein C8R44DRAFT_715417 [Mycena epipterygia]|nr:hypothetical protein C8R44DRAFT_715417 [Mycena epipterygia]